MNRAIDADGKLLEPGDVVVSTADYDEDAVHRGTVLAIVDEVLVEVTHEERCCDGRFGKGRVGRCAAFLWRVARSTRSRRSAEGATAPSRPEEDPAAPPRGTRRRGGTAHAPRRS